MGEPHTAGQVGLLDQQTVGDDLVVVRRSDDKLTSSLVVGVVDCREPVTGLVGPVVAEEGAIAVFVGPDDQSGGRHATVSDRDPSALVGLGRREQRNPQFVVLVLVLQWFIG